MQCNIWSENQTGFRKGRGDLEKVGTVNKVDLYLIFSDLEKAVDTHRLMKLLIHKCFDAKVLRDNLTTEQG